MKGSTAPQDQTTPDLRTLLTAQEAPHAPPRPQQCDLCPMEFPDVDEFETHIIRQHHKEPLECDMCEVRRAAETGAFFSLFTHAEIFFVQNRTCKIAGVVCLDIKSVTGVFLVLCSFR